MRLIKGLGSAALIIGAWVILETYALLVLNLSAPGAALRALGLVPILTFLYTGLFITAHDAMHESLAPDWPRLNRFVGALAVGLYAAFSYTKLLTAHRRHHREPASALDPDFHAEGKSGFWSWYFRFVRQYVTVAQILTMTLIAEFLRLGLHAPRLNVYLLWALPALLSTLQLFYFGTFRPHRLPPSGAYADPHRATSESFAPWLSFLTCYHFGYHWEHHADPSVPWWRLPGQKSRT